MLDAAATPRITSPQQDLVQAHDFAPMPCSRIQTGWIVVHSYAQAERWADQQLRHRGYDTYLPMMSVRRRDPVIRTISRTVQQPLFPRYLFVRFPGNWTPIRYCPGVYRIVSAAGKPNMASDAAVEAVRAVEAVSRCRIAENASWAPGLPCNLATGAFYGLPAVVTAVHGSDATIAIMMLGQLRTLSVPLDSLQPRGE